MMCDRPVRFVRVRRPLVLHLNDLRQFLLQVLGELLIINRVGDVNDELTTLAHERNLDGRETVAGFDGRHHGLTGLRA